MGKYSNFGKISQKVQQALFIRFAKALASIKNSTEAAHFIKDVLTEQEALMVARRLQIADLLEDGLTYNEIKKIAKVSDGTISKIQAWLRLYGGEFKKIMKRTHGKINVKNTSSPWNQIKKRYPIYFWPEILLKEIVASANTREKAKIISVLNRLKEKTALNVELKKLLK